MRIVSKAGNIFASLVKRLWASFDVRDVFVFGGLGMLGCGLYLKWGLWLALIVCGTLLVLLGLGWLSRMRETHGDH